MRKGVVSTIAALLLANSVQAPLAQAELEAPKSQAAAVGFTRASHQAKPLRPRGAEAVSGQAATPLAPGETGLFVAQFRDAIDEHSQQRLKEAGAEVGPYIGAQAYVIRTTAAIAQRLAADARFASVTRYSAAWKVNPSVTSGKQKALRVMTFATPDQKTGAALRALGALNGPDAATEFLVAGADRQTVDRLAALEDVLLIEPVPEVELFNDYATGIMGITAAGGPRMDGLDGRGQIVGIADTGLDTGNATTLHPDLKNHLLKPFAYGRLNNWSDPDGHGTHVAGSVLGDGTASGGQVKGSAPGAKMVFQSILTSSGGLAFPSITKLLSDAYGSGARIHTNSWGADIGGYYTSWDAEADAFTWSKRDMTVLFAAGNSGEYGSYTIGTPGTAKNVITVGASENVRPGISYTIADDANDLAVFSSRGPTADGRIKPDVVAPGTFILSTRSSLASDDSFWANYDSDYAYAGGTSMATPLTAGAAAIVRQFYAERQGVPRPSGALVKATLINGAQDMGYGWGSFDQGWGRVDLVNSLTPVGRNNWFQDEKLALSTGQTHTYSFLASAGEPLKFTLTWTDPKANPAALYNLVNDLDLFVLGPDGKEYTGNCFVGNTSDGYPTCDYDELNNVENVYIMAPQTGIYTVGVGAWSTPGGAQTYALVASGKDLVNASDLVAPTLSVTSLTDGAFVKGTLPVTALATDNVRVTSVEFRLDDTFQAIDTAAPYTWNWNTTTATPGAHTVTITARDAAGNTTSVTRDVTVDNLGPAVSFLDRTSPAYLPGGDHVMSVDATDENGIAKVEFYQGTTKKATLTEAPFTWTWSTAGLRSGTYPIVAKAYDPAGNVTSATLSVVLDTALPTVSLTQPKANSYLRGTVALTAAATDAGGITSIELGLDETILQTLTTSPYTWSWDTTTATDGPHLLGVRATDRAGNQKTSTLVPVTVDNTNPSVSLPVTEGALVRNGQVLTAVATDNTAIAKVEFILGEKVAVTDTAAPYTWTLGRLLNGTSYALSARITDKAGNSFTAAPITVTADSAAPTGVALTGLTANSTIQGVQDLTVSGTDGTGVTKVELWIDNLLASTHGPTPASIAWDTSTVTDGRHTVQAKVYDGAGNVATSAKITITVDNQDPVLGAITPENGSSIRGIATIKADATDAVGMQKVEFWLGDTLKLTDTSAPYSLSLPTTGSSGMADGDYNLTVKAFDRAGHEVARTITLRVDNTLPTVSLSGPTPGAKFGPQIVSVTADAFDSNGISHVEFYLGSTKKYTAYGLDSSWAWDTSTVRSGTYQLKAIAYDVAGNSKASAIVSVVVDSTKPTLSITGPAAGALVKGDVTVTATPKDANGIDRVEFWIDDFLDGTVTTAPYTWTYATPTLTGDGIHNLVVKAYDTLGNVMILTRGIKVDNTAPTVDFATLTEGSVVATGTRINLSIVEAVGVAKAEYYINGVKKATVTGAPYAWTLPTMTKGSYELSVIVTDKVGQVSAPATINISVDGAAPTLSVAGIKNYAVVSGTVTIEADATDDIGIDRIELWVGTTLVHTTAVGGGVTVTGAPLTWETTLTTNGSKSVRVRVYDQAGRFRELRYTVTVRN